CTCFNPVTVLHSASATAAFISLSPVKSGYNWVSGETFGHGNSALVETLETLRSGQLLPGKSFTAISPACHPDVFFPV
ncbi:hypothetical protein, partial [Pseudomonas aeruginosa]|uniref:hypothetical protein n=1 Tax=Pseudomonas aeruginosa TaxID=287 RepID=UPI001E4FCE7A